MNPATLVRVREECRRLIADNPELATDADLRADMIDGETIVGDALHALERTEAEAQADVKKIGDMIEALEARGEAAARRATAARTAIRRVLDAGDLVKWKLPQATLTVGSGRANVIMLNRDECPEEYRAHPEWRPKLKEIGEAIKRGETVPGFTLSNAEPHLTIRRTP